jgi:hypothetical protein
MVSTNLQELKMRSDDLINRWKVQHDLATGPAFMMQLNTFGRKVEIDFRLTHQSQRKSKKVKIGF